MKEKYPLEFISKEASDTEKTMTQNESHPAGPSTVTLLNSKANESKQLAFYPYAHYEVTFNDPNGTFFHSQTAIVLRELPSEEDLLLWKPVNVYVAPAGFKTFPTEGVTEEELHSMGWKLVRIGKPRENVYHLGFRGLTAKREQYGLEPRIASTIHGLQGDTMAAIVTKCTANDALWESGQVTVLLSRTRHARDIYFAGDKNATIQSLIQAMRTRNQFDDYLVHVVEQLCQGETRFIVILDQTMYYPY
jgi:hypothetical protein